MSELLFECPECESDITPEAVLESIAQDDSNSAMDVIENSDDVAHTCADCSNKITLQAAEVLVRMSINDTFLKILRTMQENESEYGLSGWSDRFREALADEREAHAQKAEIREQLNTLQNDLEDN